MSEQPQPSGAALEKALLLCKHAEEISAQCAAALRVGSMDCLLDLQARKDTIIAELASLLKCLDVALHPDLQHAVEHCREALRAEMSMLIDGSNDLQNELLTVNAAQRRLVHARRYDTAAQPLLSVNGGQLSVCG